MNLKMPAIKGTDFRVIVLDASEDETEEERFYNLMEQDINSVS